MTKLLQHIEEMRARLKEVADNEQSLVRALGEALNRLDQQLLRDVRTIATEHEVRREAILGELQNLAAGVGMFRAPMQHTPVEGQGYAPADGHKPAIAPGDWRQATSNIEDDYEMDVRFNGRTPSH